MFEIKPPRRERIITRYAAAATTTKLTDQSNQTGVEPIAVPSSSVWIAAACKAVPGIRARRPSAWATRKMGVNPLVAGGVASLTDENQLVTKVARGHPAG